MPKFVRSTWLWLGLGVVPFVAGATAALAQATPENNQTDNAFVGQYYVCDSGKDAFVLMYDGPDHKQAIVDTSTQKHIVLDRTPVATGQQFSNKTVKLWTDGQRITLTGLPHPYQDCKRSTS